MEVPATLESIELDTPYLASLPYNGITDEGAIAITRYVYDSIAKPAGIEYTFSWPNWWEWSWVVTKDLSGNKCVGTFPKRLARYLIKNFDVKMTSQQMAELGSLARSHTIESDNILFDLTQDFDWGRGQYGDPVSCYWGDYNHSRTEVLPSLGAYAIRFYSLEREIVDMDEWHRTSIRNWEWYCPMRNQNVQLIDVCLLSDNPCYCGSCYAQRMAFTQQNEIENARYGRGVYAKYWCKALPANRGVGRAWIVPQDDMLLLFNAYGPYQSLHAARLLATILGLSYKSIHVESNPEEALYLNGDAFAIAPPETLESLKRYTIECDWEGEDCYSCANCGDDISEDDSYLSRDGGAFCHSCYNDLYINCDRCGDAAPHDGTVDVDNDTWCQECSENYSFYCEICDENFRDPCEEHHCVECGENVENMEEHDAERHADDGD